MKTLLAVCSLLLVTSGMGGAQATTEPQLKRADLPMYPVLARQARIEGIVKLLFVIKPDGSVADVQALSGHPMLKAAAIQNVASWRFRPGYGTGDRQTTELIFKLSGKDVPSSPKLTVALESFHRVEVTTDVLLIADSP